MIGLAINVSDFKVNVFNISTNIFLYFISALIYGLGWPLYSDGNVQRNVGVKNYFQNFCNIFLPRPSDVFP
jgi:hypothetical protein